MDDIQKATLIHIPLIENARVMAFAVSEVRKYFLELGQAPPDMPDDVLSFIPSELLITEDGNFRKFNRSIKFIKPDGSLYYGAEWSQSSA